MPMVKVKCEVNALVGCHRPVLFPIRAFGVSEATKNADCELLFHPFIIPYQLNARAPIKACPPSQTKTAPLQ